MRQLAYAMVAGALAVTTLADSAPAAANCDDPFADPDDVLELHLRISRADWSSLRFDDMVGSGCDAQYPYFEVGFWCGDEAEITIGARRKRGDQRGSDTDEKPPIKLDFNRYVVGQRWPEARGSLGFRKLSLNNGQEDNPGGVLSALLTEHYAWRLMRAEVPTAGGVAYARVYVQFTDDDEIEYHGIYVLIEDIDRTAIRARFGADEGQLLKTTTGSCRNQVVFDDGPPIEALDGFDAWFDADPGGTYEGGWYGETDRAIDLEELLRQEAVRDVLANGQDTPLGQNYSNFFSYDPRQGRRRYLPWDLDDCFRPYPQDVAYDFALDDSCSPIGQRTRCNSDIRERYLEIACQLVNGTLAEERLLADFEALDALLRPIIAEEIALVWPDKDPFDENTDGTYASEYVRVREWITSRIPDLRAQITAEGFDCSDGCEEAASESCDYLHCEGERRCEAGRWTTCLVDPELEIPDNQIDDDCDGRVDENGTGSADAGVDPGSDGGSSSADAGSEPGADNPDLTSGCACRSGMQGSAATWLLLLGAMLAACRRRQTPRRMGIRRDRY